MDPCQLFLMPGPCLFIGCRKAGPATEAAPGRGKIGEKRRGERPRYIIRQRSMVKNDHRLRKYTPPETVMTDADERTGDLQAGKL